MKKGYKKHHTVGGRDRLARIYNGMISRCYNSNVPNYKHYGGSGVIVCEEWKNSKHKFYDWALENGYDENLTIDRKEPTGPYNPKNCRWETKETQARNKRGNSYNVSGYKCVYPTKTKKNPWRTIITIRNSPVNLGTYKTPKDAAIAYNKYVEENKLQHTKIILERIV